MEWNNIRLEGHEGWALLTIDRPKVLNALNRETLDELEQALDRVEESGDIRALIITGSGEKAFVAGADIKELREIPSAHEAERLAEKGQALFSRLEELPVPVIMAAGGFALGGGFELALSGDILLASEKARFGLPEVNLGILPGYGGTQRLARLVGKSTAKYYALTGEMIPAEEAYRLGIVQKVVPHEQLLPEAKSLARTLSKQAPVAMNFIKKSINQGAETDLKTGLRLEASHFGTVFNTEDRMEGMDAFLEKRKASFRGK
ncbi:short chain enoyl-CoA hydratase [Melghirimyces profundicolus]|uniref:Short chain enoyl-CoA hydratase n=1 Tax=Melghirimyces profundicolus TaxID=1242148 RepID=A0A2T6C2Q2_9BACL|nr:enoyl-CoA hydratase-related protein [Melghirimyces profundicolus]PTX62578.1 short chain enoyl-CoA hydratase [Melghirimyces profundicolus]